MKTAYTLDELSEIKNDTNDNSVKLSADGNYAVVCIDAGVRAALTHFEAYVFVKAGGHWTQQAKLHANNSTGDASFDNAVTISPDGSYVALITYSNHSGDGGNWFTGRCRCSVTVFKRSGISWAQEAELVPEGLSQRDTYRGSVTISADSNYIAFGLYGETPDFIDRSGIYIFKRSGSIWRQQAELVDISGNGGRYYGDDIYVSDDGGYLAALVCSDHKSYNSLALYGRNGMNWRHAVTVSTRHSLNDITKDMP